MFEIELSPCVCAKDALAVSVAGQIITINCDEIDLSGLQDGDVLPYGSVDHAYVAGKVTKSDGVIHLRLLFPISEAAPEAARFPVPIMIIEDGPVVLPDNGN